MIVVPNDGNIWLYGPALDDVESELVFEEDYDQLPELRKYMLEMMRKTKAIGLAAPQVGVFKRFILVEMADGGVMDMINPDIVSMTGKEIMGVEGCLSVPPAGNDCAVPRMQRIIVECSTSHSPKQIGNVVLGNRDAVITQHEIDHLTGTFFFDRVSTAVKRNVLDRFNHWKMENLPNEKTKPVTAYRL